MSTNSREQRRAERRSKIHQDWTEHYEDLLTGEVTLAEILGYDDAKLMRLAGKGLRLFKVGKLKVANQVFKALVVLDPFVPYFHYLYGSGLEKQNELQAADREYAKVLDQTSEMSPRPEIAAFALLGRGRVLARQGNPTSALEALEDVVDGSVPCSDASVLATTRAIVSSLRKLNPSAGGSA